jgi:dienelactone hydrolase
MAIGMAAAMAGVQESESVGKARAAFRLLVEEKFAEFVSLCDDAMKSALPEEKLKDMWNQFVAAVGPFEKEQSAVAIPVGDLTTVEFVNKFARATLKVRIALHGDGRIGGLFFVPAGEPGSYKPPDYVEPARFREEEVTVKTGHFELPGTLTLPVSKEPCAAVVLVHGSGPHDRDETVLGNKPFRDIAWGLGSRGVAVLRYEKRTLKYGMMTDPTTLTLDTEAIDDAVSAARLVMERKEIDGRRVFVFGHSLGALAAPRAVHLEPRIAGVVLAAGTPRSLAELIPEQIEYLSRVDGSQEGTGKEHVEKVKAAAASIREGTWKSGETLLGAPVEYWARLHKIDAVDDLRKVGGPALILQGSRDYQVTAEKDFAIWQREFGGRPNVTLKLFDGLDHLFRRGEGPSTPQQYQIPGHVDESVISYLAEWILRQEPGN